MTLFRSTPSQTFQNILPLDPENPESMGFTLLNLEKTNFYFESFDDECAIVLLQGEGRAIFHNETIPLKRTHWQDENPTVFHLSSKEEIFLETETQCRFAIVSTKNKLKFASRFYTPESVTVEHRGKGILNDTCYRLVRTVFDHSSAPKESKLVLGEVVNFPGRWSSYPPHHHAQDEIYYYEFNSKEGFGFGQCGEEVTKIQHQDLLYIPGGNDHSQVSAPGYFLYYIWAIRHGFLPYTGFEYTKPYDKVLTE